MKVRIAAVSQSKSLGRSVGSNLKFITRTLQNVLEHAPDVVCLPEAFTAKGVPITSVADVAETVPGPTIDAIADLAAKHHCYIICPIYTVRDGVFRNSAVLIDNAGAIAGIYDKARPCASSADYTVFEEGIVPGTGPGYFDLAVGRIGIRICMDAEFPEDWKDLEDNGVRVVFWPSALDGGILLQAHAIQHHYYVVSAVRAGRSRIVDPCGHILAETAPNESYVIADVNLDFVVLRHDPNNSTPERIAAKYGDRMIVKTYPEEGLFLIEPAFSDLTTSQVCFELGLEPARQVRERHAAAYHNLKVPC
jgi:predicted amidohydrolase